MPRKWTVSGLRDPWSVVYSQTATDGFNARLHGVLRDLTRDSLAAIGNPLVALVVAGSYGEGRGSCVPVKGGFGSGLWSHGQAPADDVEILVVANARKRNIQKLLEPVSRKYSAILKVPVRFFQIVDETELGRVRPTLAWYELVQSHQLLFGSEAVFDPLKRRLGIQDDACGDPDFPADEARWLHTYSGFRTIALLLERRHPSRNPGRQYFQAVRRLGDAVLVYRGHWSVDRDERDRLVLALAEEEEWFRQHRAETAAFHELYRSSMAWFDGQNRAVSETLAGEVWEAHFDVPGFARAWLLVAQSLDHLDQGGKGRGAQSWRQRLIHRWVRAWFAAYLRRGRRSPRGSGPRGLRDGLFVQLGEWYYRCHQ